ncbi:MAG: nucleotidyltransferase domain-containing protein [Saccharolobus sp.]|uniref:nucleotidyltransferase domain-containing protein n=1 Tax=Saccharolobus TaxID=2100760 RepID=UPI001C456EDE|nr:nucleotidyltransferase domain-containing protein [Saccharolobus shibatae]MCH4816423.1 nucleotidyltransferase domain-containing protein [Saccharolobus shibatae]
MFGLERIRFLEENWRRITLLVLNASRKFIDVKEAVVYGSVIKGKAMGSSDLDIALIVRNLDVKRLTDILVKIHLSLPEEISEIVDLNLIDEKDEEDFLKFVGKYVILN